MVIGCLDTIMSYDISISILYVFPIMLIAWYEGGVPAALLSIFSAVTWAVSDLTSGHMYSHVSVPIWNAIVVLGIFLIVAFSITAIKKLLIKARECDHTDDLTCVANVRFFYEQARLEISRLAMHKQPLTVAYIGIDNLRQVNDTLGHIAGDYLLHEAAQAMKSTVRSIDIISRLGGAKFAILMPKTNNNDAEVAIRKVQERLSDMVKQKGWPVTFSIGVVICNVSTYTIDELIKMAEDLVNAARADGKNLAKYRIVDLPSAASQ